MNTLVQIAAVLAAATISSTSIVKTSTDTGENFELLILHNNDMHARFEQTSQLSGTCTTEDRDAGKCYGGFPRVAHVVKEARKAAASGEGPPVLYLNAGDTYTGTAWFTIYKWKIAAEFINALQPDAVSLGNHEFDNGVRGLTPFIEHLTCPILAANLVLDNVPELAQQTNLKKSIVFNLSGTKVGIIGYLTPETKVLAIKNDVEYTDEIVAIKEEVTILQNAGVKIIIALGHSGYIVDKKIAQEVEGLDLVIGGHSHTFLWEGPNPDTEDAEGSYPTYITQSSGKIVPVVQAYAFTKYFGKIHLFFNSDGEMISSDGRPIILDKTIPEDPQILTILERYQREVQSISNEVVGNTSVVLDGRSCEKRECNLGNLIVDSVVYTYAKKYKGEHWTDAPIAIIQAGGIRSSIARTEMPTEITKGDLLTVMPFKGHLVTVAMNGSVLIKMLEHSIARYEIPKVGEFLQISGLKVVYDINKPVGSRVVKAVARCWACNIPEYSKVDNKQIYKVLMPKFVAMGGDGYSMLKNLPSTTLSFSELLSTQYYVRQHSPVFPEVEGRIVIHDKHEESSSIIISSSLSLTILSIIITFT